MSPDDAIQPNVGRLQRFLENKTAKQILPFPDLSEADAQRILDLGTVQQIDLAKTCFEEGDYAQNFYVLLDGVVRVVRSTAEGEQVVVMHIAPGELFGIAHAFDNDTHHASARVAAPGIALSWPSELWDQFTRDYPGFTLATRKAVGGRVEELQDKVVEMATLNVERRIAHALLRLARQVGAKTKKGLEINFRVTRQDISEMTGTTLHSVSRYMSKWQKNGILNSTRRGSVILRPDALPL